jgi:hypothetical protein
MNNPGKGLRVICLATGLKTSVRPPILVLGLAVLLAASSAAAGSRFKLLFMYEPDVDAPDLPLVWAGKNGASLAGKTVQLRFYFRNARIYAVAAR